MSQSRDQAEDVFRRDRGTSAPSGYGSDRGMENGPDQPKRDEWKIWPPSPKVQILLIAAAFGLINLCLLAVWAYIMIRRF